MNSRDISVLLGGTAFVIVSGVLGNAVQDVAYAGLDPNVDRIRATIDDG